MEIPKLQTFDYQQRPRAGHGPAVGVLALSEDITIEADLRHFLPSWVDLHCARVPCAAQISQDTLSAMGEELSGALARLVPNSPLDVVAYGCTSGSMVLGSDQVTACIQQQRPDMPVTDPLRAARAYLAHHKIRRLAVLLPYETPLCQQVLQALCANSDRQVVAAGSFLCNFDPEVMRIDEASIQSAVKALCAHRSVDGVFISCTALRLNAVIEPLQQQLGIPISGSNHALAWHIEHLLGTRR